MKTTLCIVLLALGLAAGTRAVEPAPAAPAGREVQDLTADLRRAEDRLKDLEARLEKVEKRLGDTYQLPTPFNTIERRLEDIEKDLKRR